MLKRDQDHRGNGRLTEALWPRSCRLPAPGPVRRGSSGQCAAASDRTAASGWCTGPGRTSPAGRASQLHDGRWSKMKWVARARHTSFMVKTSLMAPACWSKRWNSMLGRTWKSRQEAASQDTTMESVRQEVGITHQLVVVRGVCAELSVSWHDDYPAERKQTWTPFNLKQSKTIRTIILSYASLEPKCGQTYSFSDENQQEISLLLWQSLNRQLRPDES